ncbi:hypothetical protein RHGRI_010853 [Rhododendron griersonianum]|uniref:Protein DETOXIFICATION n=1 Tax=Rhododendron griersonianum TaxID=479676 RepID=A0AAV6KL59_9ERIC|nr:hypothetical protein RHGRI_010853 [Rhododendron griersonianum]
MASGLTHHLFCIQSLHHQFRCSYYSTTPPCKASILLPNPNLSLRLRTKSAPRESPSTSLERSAQEPETPISSNRVKSPDPSPGSNSSLDSISLLLRPLRDGLKVDQLGLEILSIALPVALALAADPLTSLVDTAFVGRLGSVELAAVGVSVSVFNLVSKLFNVPLLNITTSFVAEEQALVPKSRDESHQIDQAAGNLLNAILDPILIFIFGLGIGGAAIATVISEYLIAVILLWKLNSKVLLVSPKIDGGRVFRYLKSGGLLITRSLAVLVTMTLATSMAAREGPIAMAGHQICLQVWLAVSLLTDALALAGQALLAGDYSQGDYGKARQVVNRIIQVGSLCICHSNLAFRILFVAGSQPINALAFVLDGLYYGVSDFGYAAYSMVLVGMISSVFLVIAAPLYGLAGVWTGLFLFMTLRVVAGIWRLGTKAGPWKFLWSEMEQENT